MSHGGRYHPLLVRGGLVRGLGGDSSTFEAPGSMPSSVGACLTMASVPTVTVCGPVLALRSVAV